MLIFIIHHIVFSGLELAAALQSEAEKKKKPKPDVWITLNAAKTAPSIVNYNLQKDLRCIKLITVNARKAVPPKIND